MTNGRPQTKRKPTPKAAAKKFVAAPKPQGYSYERTTLGNPTYAERIPPVKKVPGTRAAKWDRTIGRHVVGHVKSDAQRAYEMGQMVW